MDELVKNVFTAPVATLFIVAGTIFLLIAVVGNISGRIQPGTEGRIVSGILGLSFILAGLTMHLLERELQTPAPSTTEQAQFGPSQSSEPPRTPNSSDIPKKEVSRPGMQTRYAGVIASLTRFEKTGQLITVEITIKNSSNETHIVCSGSSAAKLIDEATGESWMPIQYGGAYGACDWLPPDHDGGAWMKFKVPDAEKKVFSFGSPLLNSSWDNLVLQER